MISKTLLPLFALTTATCLITLPFHLNPATLHLLSSSPGKNNNNTIPSPFPTPHTTILADWPVAPFTKPLSPNPDLQILKRNPPTTFRSHVPKRKIGSPPQHQPHRIQSAFLQPLSDDPAFPRRERARRLRLPCCGGGGGRFPRVGCGAGSGHAGADDGAVWGGGGLWGVG